MATTGIWEINDNLKVAVEYISKEEKTKINEEDYKDLHNAIDYIESDYKTEEKNFVTSINCDYEYALEQMKITKRRFSKEGGVLGYHAFQSFREGEVTPAQAHEIGIKTAQEMWGDRFEVIVATHTNTDNIHNHFVFNSVSFLDGKKYCGNRRTYADLRQTSDAICSEYGISVLEEKPCKRSKINFANYYKGTTEKNNYFTLTRRDVDNCIKEAYTYDDFIKLLKKMNYKVVNRYGKLSLTRKNYKKPIRIERSFGKDYSIENIKKRIDEEQVENLPFTNEIVVKKTINPITYQKVKAKGIVALYRYYCYLLKIYPSNIRKHKLSYDMRLDINRMDRLSENNKFLASENINTNEEFFLFKNELKDELSKLLSERSLLWIRTKKAETISEQEQVMTQIQKLNEMIKPLQEKKKHCDEIEKEQKRIIEKLDKYFEEVGKEVEHESIK